MRVLRAAKRNRQRGVALMMTLAVLALLIILAMSFSYTAQTDRQGSAIAADLTRARLLCESGLERVLAAMRLQYANPAALPAPPNPPAHPYPAREVPVSYLGFVHSGSGQYTAMSRQGSMPTADASGLEAANIKASIQVPGVEDANVYAALAGIADRSWQHVKDSGKLVGRMAWAVLDEGGKIDATGAVAASGEEYVDTNGNGAWDSGEFYFDANRNGSRDGRYDETVTTPRTGGSLQEVTVDNRFYGKLNPASPRWFSLGHLYQGTALTTAEYVKYCADSYDIEAYWDTAAGEDKQRFDLSGQSWGGWDAMNNASTAVDWLVAGGTDFWSAAPRAPASVQVYPGGSDGGIAWLAGMEDDDGLDVSKQVAANIIDYSDSDGTDPVATTDLDWAAGTVTYCGLEQVACINEVGFSATYFGIRIPVLPLYTGTFTMTASIELVNPYAVAAPAGLLDIEIDYSFGGASKPSAVPAAHPLVVNGIPMPGVAANSYTVISVPALVSTWTWDVNEFGSVEVTVRRVRARLYSASGTMDVSMCCASGVNESPTGVVPVNPPGSPLTMRSNSIEVADPRCNTLTKHWSWHGAAGWDTSLAGGTTMGSSNAPLSDPNGAAATKDLDNAPGNDVSNGMSTAFVRNAPMQSLWEMGAIHRGGPFQTINLRAYAVSPGGYIAGDAGLLDQLKLSPGTYSVAKFSANSASAVAWTDVLANLKRDDPYNAPGTGTTPIPATAIDIVGVLPGSPVNGGWVSRGQLVSVTSLATGCANDREAESGVGKLANLLTTRQNYFTVLVVAQSVKDTGVVNPGANGVQYDTTNNLWCTVLAEQRMVATVYRDALANEYRVDRVEFIEE